MKNLWTLISNMTIVLKIRHKTFFPKCKEFLFLHETSELDKFEGDDFKYDNSFFIKEIQPKNIQIKQFWSQIWEFLILH